MNHLLVIRSFIEKCRNFIKPDQRVLIEVVAMNLLEISSTQNFNELQTSIKKEILGLTFEILLVPKESLFSSTKEGVQFLKSFINLVGNLTKEETECLGKLSNFTSLNKIFIDIWQLNTQQNETKNDLQIESFKDFIREQNKELINNFLGHKASIAEKKIFNNDETQTEGIEAKKDNPLTAETNILQPSKETPSLEVAQQILLEAMQNVVINPIIPEQKTLNIVREVAPEIKIEKPIEKIHEKPAERLIMEEDNDDSSIDVPPIQF